MHYLRDRGFVHPHASEITPRPVHEGRRALLQGLAAGAAGLALAGWASRDALAQVARPGKLAALPGARSAVAGALTMGECHYRSGNYEAINRFELVKMILEHLGIYPERFHVQWISAAESIRFVEAITAFDNHIRDIGLLGQKENLNRKKLQHKLRAARMSVETKMFRMVFAKQAKQIKENGTYGEFPSKDKLMETFMNERAT